MPAEEAARRERVWYQSWLDQLRSLDFDALGLEGKVHYILLRNRVEFDSEDDPPGGEQGRMGAEALRQHLLREMIPYTAEEGAIASLGLHNETGLAYPFAESSEDWVHVPSSEQPPLAGEWG